MPTAHKTQASPHKVHGKCRLRNVCYMVGSGVTCARGYVPGSKGLRAGKTGSLLTQLRMNDLARPNVT